VPVVVGSRAGWAFPQATRTREHTAASAAMIGGRMDLLDA
jgi:hypothetical protein